MKIHDQTLADFMAENARIDAASVRQPADQFDIEDDAPPVLPPLTLDALLEAEPELYDLFGAVLRVADEVRGDWNYCSERVWKHGAKTCPSLKPWLQKLVGWHSGHPHDRLGTSFAYMLVVDEIARLLPACRCCRC